MLLGFLFVRPVPPLPEQASPQSLEDVREPAHLPAPQHHNHSRTPLLNDGSIKDRYIRNDITTDGENSNSVGGVVEATHSVQVSDQKHSTPLNVHGIALLRNFDFWLLFSIYSLRMFPFSGFFIYFNILYYKDSCWDWLYMYVLNCSKIFTGIIISPLTDINNVGSMSRSLYAHNNPTDYDEAQALRWQAAQVSAISFTNFGGRIFIGTAHSIPLLPFCLNILIQASFRTLQGAYIEHHVLTVSF